MISVVSHGLYSEVARWVSKLQVKPNPAASSCALPRKSTCCASGQRSLPASKLTKRGLRPLASAKRVCRRARCCSGVFMLGGEHPAAAEKNGDILQPRRLQAVGELPPLGHR